MSPDLQTLIQLQEVDNQLLRLERAKGNAPQQLEQLRHEIASITSVYDEIESRFEETKQQRRSLESRMASIKELKKKYDTQLYSVKTNKEYDAITLEIENTEKEIDESETRMLELMEEEEKLSAEIAGQKEQIEALKNDVQGQEAILNQLMEETRSQVERLTAERENLTHQLNSNALRNYDRIRNGKEDGIAVTPVKDYNCMSCHTRMPPQTVVEIREMKQLFYCESCGRILVYTEEELVNA